MSRWPLATPLRVTTTELVLAVPWSVEPCRTNWIVCPEVRELRVRSKIGKSSRRQAAGLIVIYLSFGLHDELLGRSRRATPSTAFEQTNVLVYTATSLPFSVVFLKLSAL